MKIKHPVQIIVFGVVISDGDIMLAFISARSLTLNTNAKIKCQKEGVLLWIKRETVERSYV